MDGDDGSKEDNSTSVVAAEGKTLDVVNDSEVNEMACTPTEHLKTSNETNTESLQTKNDKTSDQVATHQVDNKAEASAEIAKVNKKTENGNATSNDNGNQSEKKDIVGSKVQDVPESFFDGLIENSNATCNDNGNQSENKDNIVESKVQEDVPEGFCDGLIKNSNATSNHNANQSENKDNILESEVQEEDVPESFFDDLMSEDFIEGLNVVDTWEGDDCAHQEEEKNVKKTLEVKTSSAPNKDSNADNRKRRQKGSNDKHVESRKNSDKIPKKEHRRSKRSNSRSKAAKIPKSASRRDPNKTQRDILRDKDKCEKDKTTKILHEKLKVVETGLVPPGMEMETELQSFKKVDKLEDGELPTEKANLAEERIKNDERRQNSLEKRRRNKSGDQYSPFGRDLRRTVMSPEYRRKPRKSNSRSRSPRKRFSPRNHSRSIERRESRKRATYRSRSRSTNYRELSLDKYSRLRSPPRKSSRLTRHLDDDLLKELNELKRKLHAEDELLKSKVHDTFTAGNSQAFPSRTTSFDFMQKPPVQYQPPTQNYMPVQPVPPPLPASQVELDQQFFIGQTAFESLNYSVPAQQHPVMQNHLGPPNMQHGYQQNWNMEQPMNYFNANSGANVEHGNYQQQMGGYSGYEGSHTNTFQPEQPPYTMQENKEVQRKVKLEPEKEIFAKLLADNKITLTDYLSVTAKSTDSTNPVDIQNKIKVISHCQDALSEINGTSKPTGKFYLRKSQKNPIKLGSSAEGLSPFKKVPVIKFQFTTFTKPIPEKNTLSTALNRLLSKIGREALFQDAPQSSTPSKSTSDTANAPKRLIDTQKTSQTLNKFVQTEAVSTADFGCQVTPEDIPSPRSYKQQSLAKLTPAQLLARSMNDTSPPPPPKWKLYTDDYRNYNETERIRTREGGWFSPPRNVVNPSELYIRPPDEQNHHLSWR